MTKNEELNKLIDEIKELCQPDSVHLCDGSEKENQTLCDLDRKSVV